MISEIQQINSVKLNLDAKVLVFSCLAFRCRGGEYWLKDFGKKFATRSWTIPMNVQSMRVLWRKLLLILLIKVVLDNIILDIIKYVIILSKLLKISMHFYFSPKQRKNYSKYLVLFILNFEILTNSTAWCFKFWII